MLVNCAAYRDGHKIADLTTNQIKDYLDKPGTFVWVALKDPELTELEKMGMEFDLHPLAVEDAGHGHQSPKIEEYGDSLFMVLHTIEMGADCELLVGELNVFVGKNYVISCRAKSEKGFTNVRERCEREPDLFKNGSAFVFYALMDAVVDRYFPVVAALEHELEQVEEKIFSKSASARLIIEELYALKRKMMTLQHAVAPLLPAVGKLHGGRVPQVCVNMQEYFRDVDDHLMRVSKSIESIREMITTAIQVNLSLIALGESEVGKKLASYAALFGVPTAIAGIYGMNFKNMPELETTWGYPVVVAVIVIIDLLLWRRFKRGGWL